MADEEPLIRTAEEALAQWAHYVRNGVHGGPEWAGVLPRGLGTGGRGGEWSPASQLIALVQGTAWFEEARTALRWVWVNENPRDLLSRQQEAALAMFLAALADQLPWGPEPCRGEVCEADEWPVPGKKTEEFVKAMAALKEATEASERARKARAKLPRWKGWRRWMTDRWGASDE